VRSRGSDFDIPVVFSLIIALLRNKGFVSSAASFFSCRQVSRARAGVLSGYDDELDLP
ncbi:hypothetical protein Tco_1533975, partial [Tanacetum coccineum]